MTKAAFYEALDYVNASREKRSSMAQRVLENPQLIPLLIEVVKDNHEPISCKASWVLEYVAKKDLWPILNNIDEFISSLPVTQLESSIRPAAKICELLMKSYFSKKPNPSRMVLTDKHLNTIAESAFDWLIGDHKVAPKAYSMTTLLLLGHKINWIYPELQLVLTQHYAAESAAYKSRARMTLNQLEKIKK